MKSNGNKAANGKHSSPDCPVSHPIIPPRGDYQTLLSFQKAEVAYDITFRFAHKYLSRGDRTVDQMIQAARSGKDKNSKEAQYVRRLGKRITRARLAYRNKTPALDKPGNVL
jgi:hypothetical protein